MSGAVLLLWFIRKKKEIFSLTSLRLCLKTQPQTIATKQIAKKNRMYIVRRSKNSKISYTIIMDEKRSRKRAAEFYIFGE